MLVEVFIKSIKIRNYESLSAYGVGIHRHNSEIQQELDFIQKRKTNLILPHIYHQCLGGILTTIYVDLKKE